MIAHTKTKLRYYRSLIDWVGSEEITQDEYLRTLASAYKNANVFDSVEYDKNNPVRTPFAYFYTEVMNEH